MISINSAIPSYSNLTYYDAKIDDLEHLQNLRNLLYDTDRAGFGQIKNDYYNWIIIEIDGYLEKLLTIKEQ